MINRLSALVPAGSAQGSQLGSLVPAAPVSVNPIEQEYFHRLETDYPGLKREYNAHKDTEGGRMLNTDIARELSPHYLKDRTKAADVHEPSSAFIKRNYAEKLAERTPKGLKPTVVFTAGGTGAGKSTGLKILQEVNPHVRNAEIYYDTNMNTYDSAEKKIEQALKAKRKVSIIYTHRDPVEAFENGTLTRAMGQERDYGSGRVVPLLEQVKTHIGARKVIRELMQKYKNDGRVTFDLIDNSRGRGNAKRSTLEELPELADEETIARGVRDVLERARQSGKISEHVYRGTLANAK